MLGAASIQRVCAPPAPAPWVRTGLSFTAVLDFGSVHQETALQTPAPLEQQRGRASGACQPSPSSSCPQPPFGPVSPGCPAAAPMPSTSMTLIWMRPSTETNSSSARQRQSGAPRGHLQRKETLSPGWVYLKAAKKEEISPEGGGSVGNPPHPGEKSLRFPSSTALGLGECHSMGQMLQGTMLQGQKRRSGAATEQSLRLPLGEEEEKG